MSSTDSTAAGTPTHSSGSNGSNPSGTHVSPDSSGDGAPRNLGPTLGGCALVQMVPTILQLIANPGEAPPAELNSYHWHVWRVGNYSLGRHATLRQGRRAGLR